MMDLEDEVRDLQGVVALMATSVAYLMEWAEQAEISGAVPHGVMARAKKVVEIGKIQDEIASFTEAIGGVDDGTSPTLHRKLQERVLSLQSRLGRLIGELNAT